MSSTWPVVPLGDLLNPATSPQKVFADQIYPNFGIYSFGRGLFKKPPIAGSATSAKTLFRVRAGQFIYSRLFAFEGAYGLVPDVFDGYFISNEYPTFEVDQRRLEPRYLLMFFQRPSTWQEASGLAVGMGDRRRRIQPEGLLRYKIPLPPIAEQRRLVELLDALAGRLEEAQAETTQIAEQNARLLRTSMNQITANAPRRPLGELAPLTRRPATVDPMHEYPQVSVRSFGRGSFHNPPLKGSDITWEKPHLVKAGDILISNIKAWEGAIAVAKPEDDGRFGSHRYLTYVPVPGLATARFLCSYLLTPEGLHHVGEASPGSADRNRTTSAKGLLEIPVPLPTYEQQLWFGELYDKVEVIRELQTQTTAGRAAMLPVILDRAFRGEL